MGIRFNMDDLIRGRAEVKDMMDEVVLETTKKITLDVHANVVRGSPVRDGTFRGAWEVETPTKAGDSGKIINTTVYGPQLAKGHSPQAPDGWIENAIEAATRLRGK
ncbi:hypothetical protein ACT9ST_08435 [Sphingobium limneticum]